MRLVELAFTSCIFGNMFDNRELEDFRTNNGPINIAVPRHRQFLLNLLRLWGMRNLARVADEAASEQLEIFHRQFGDILPDGEINLWDLQDEDLEVIGEAYTRLLGYKIRYNDRKGHQRNTSFGDTGAAKILYALRPKSLLRWDNDIKENLQQDEIIDGDVPGVLYTNFIRYVRDNDIAELSQDCENAGFPLAELPVILSVPNDTIPKLIDGYYWITVTKGLGPHLINTMQTWAQWLDL